MEEAAENDQSESVMFVADSIVYQFLHFGASGAAYRCTRQARVDIRRSGDGWR